MRNYKIEFEKRVEFIKSVLAESGAKGIPFEFYFQDFLTKLVGAENSYTYSKFMEIKGSN